MGGLSFVVLVLLRLWGRISLYQYFTYFFKHPPMLFVVLGFLLVICGYVEYVMVIPLGLHLQVVWLIIRCIRRR